MTDRPAPEREADVGSLAWLESLSFEERFAHTVVWAKYGDQVEPSYEAYTACLTHLRWATAQLAEVRAPSLHVAGAA